MPNLHLARLKTRDITFEFITFQVINSSAPIGKEYITDSSKNRRMTGYNSDLNLDYIVNVVWVTDLGEDDWGYLPADVFDIDEGVYVP